MLLEQLLRSMTEGQVDNMTYILGIDTGGTYTDAVIIDSKTRQILSKSKVLTTKNDLKIGIAGAIDSLKIKDSSLIKMVCLSTTLATNAVVENRGYKTGLISIGREPGENTPAQYVYNVSGKINIKGIETEPLMESEIRNAVACLQEKTDAIAVSGYASVRNPSQEIRVKEIVQDMSELPVFCAHELSGNLGFEERTNTAVLNAGLIGIVKEFVAATKEVLNNKGIRGRLMIVKSDGSLMDEKMASERPIETVLSGPAASITGAAALTGIDSAILLDMGGTTVDIADYNNKSVKIRTGGTRAAEWKTSVRAVDVSTHGIGGDSWIQIDENNIKAGPLKAEPVSRVSFEHKEYLDELRQVQSLQVSDAKKLEYSRRYMYIGKDKGISKTPHTYWYFKNHEAAADLLSEMHVVDITPTDLLAVRGIYTDNLNAEAAKIRLGIIAEHMGIDTDRLVQMMTREVEKTIYMACFQSFADFSEKSIRLNEDKAAVYLIEKMFSAQNDSFLHVRAGLKKPIVAVGAPVRAWLPYVADRMNTELIIPENSEVANAVGAALGYIYESAEALVRKEKKGNSYCLFLPHEKREFKTKDEAVAAGLAILKNEVSLKAKKSGSENAKITAGCEDIFVDAFGNSEKSYVETRITAEALGEPMF